MKAPAGKHLMDLVAVDWFKDSKRMDHVAKRPGCAAQVRIRTLSILFYFIRVKLNLREKEICYVLILIVIDTKRMSNIILYILCA